MSEPINYGAALSSGASMPQPQLGAALLGGIQNALQMQVQRQQMQRQLTQQQMLDQATQQFITDPSPQNVRALAALNPTGFTAIKEQHDMQTRDVQTQNLGDAVSFQGLVRADRIDDAKALAQQRIEADTAAGIDPRAPKMLLDALNADPTGKKADALSTYLISGMMGPDKYAETFKTLTDNDRATAEEPGKLADQAAGVDLKKAQTAQALATAQTTLNPNPETAVAPQTDANGNPVFYNPKGAPPAGVGVSGSSSPALAALVPKLIASERAPGNPGGTTQIRGPDGKPTSTAAGDGQFIKKTWLEQVRAQRPDLAEGKTDPQILAMRADPTLSAQITTGYAQQNAATLQGAGLPVNGATLAMAHKLGPGGAQTVLRADPSAPMASILSPEVIKANPQLARLTAGQYATGLAKQFGTDAVNTQVDPSATGEEYLATLPPARARLIKAIANGDQPGPTGRNISSGAGQALMQQVLQYDPTASSTTLATRMATRKDFTSGQSSNEVKALETFAGHAGKLDKAINNLHNSQLPWFNGPAQLLGAKVFGDADTQKRVADFKTWAGLAAGEVVKLTRGGEGSEADIRYWKDRLNSADSPVALHQVVQDMAEAVQTRLESLQNKYNSGMSRTSEPLPHLSGSTIAVIKHLAGEAGGGGTAPLTATNDKGQTVVYDPASRQWKPG